MVHAEAPPRRLITNSSDRTLRQFNLPLSYPSQLEEEEQETPQTLRDKQSKMEHLVYRVWTYVAWGSVCLFKHARKPESRCSVLSAFEESSAACISDMLRQVSAGQYLEAIRQAEKFILHVEVLFATIDDLETHFARQNTKGNI